MSSVSPNALTDKLAMPTADACNVPRPAAGVRPISVRRGQSVKLKMASANARGFAVRGRSRVMNFAGMTALKALFAIKILAFANNPVPLTSLRLQLAYARMIAHKDKLVTKIVIASSVPVRTERVRLSVPAAPVLFEMGNANVKDYAAKVP